MRELHRAPARKALPEGKAVPEGNAFSEGKSGSEWDRGVPPRKRFVPPTSSPARFLPICVLDIPVGAVYSILYHGIPPPTQFLTICTVGVLAGAVLTTTQDEVGFKKTGRDTTATHSGAIQPQPIRRGGPVCPPSEKPGAAGKTLQAGERGSRNRNTSRRDAGAQRAVGYGHRRHRRYGKFLFLYDSLAKSTQTAAISSTTQTALFNREKHEKNQFSRFSRLSRFFLLGCGSAVPELLCLMWLTTKVSASLRDYSFHPRSPDFRVASGYQTLALGGHTGPPLRVGCGSAVPGVLCLRVAREPLRPGVASAR